MLRVASCDLLVSGNKSSHLLLDNPWPRLLQIANVHTCPTSWLSYSYPPQIRPRYAHTISDSRPPYRLTPTAIHYDVAEPNEDGIIVCRFPLSLEDFDDFFSWKQKRFQSVSFTMFGGPRKTGVTQSLMERPVILSAENDEFSYIMRDQYPPPLSLSNPKHRHRRSAILPHPLLSPKYHHNNTTTTNNNTTNNNNHLDDKKIIRAATLTFKKHISRLSIHRSLSRKRLNSVLIEVLSEYGCGGVDIYIDPNICSLYMKKEDLKMEILHGLLTLRLNRKPIHYNNLQYITYLHKYQPDIHNQPYIKYKQSITQTSILWWKALLIRCKDKEAHSMDHQTTIMTMKKKNHNNKKKKTVKDEWTLAMSIACSLHSMTSPSLSASVIQQQLQQLAFEILSHISLSSTSLRHTISAASLLASPNNKKHKHQCLKAISSSFSYLLCTPLYKLLKYIREWSAQDTGGKLILDTWLWYNKLAEITKTQQHDQTYNNIQAETVKDSVHHINSPYDKQQQLNVINNNNK